MKAECYPRRIFLNDYQNLDNLWNERGYWEKKKKNTVLLYFGYPLKEFLVSGKKYEQKQTSDIHREMLRIKQFFVLRSARCCLFSGMSRAG